MPWAHTQAARGDIILVGDLMKSITVLRLAPDTCRLIECASRSLACPGTSFADESTHVHAAHLTTGLQCRLARDLNSNWMTAISFIGEDSYLGAESALNLFVACRKHAKSTCAV